MASGSASRSNSRRTRRTRSSSPDGRPVAPRTRSSSARSPARHDLEGGGPAGRQREGAAIPSGLDVDLLHGRHRARGQEGEQRPPGQRRAEGKAQPHLAARREIAQVAHPARCAPAPQLGRGAAEHRADDVVELAHAAEAAGQRHLDHRQLGGVEQRAGEVGAPRRGHRARRGAEVAREQPAQVALADPELGRQRAAVAAVERAVLDEAQPARHRGRRAVPGRRAGRRLRAAAPARAKAGRLGRGRAGEEAHVAAQRRAGRADRPAVDAGGHHRGEEAAVEARVAAAHRLVAQILVQHRYQMVRNRRAGRWRFSDPDARLLRSRRETPAPSRSLGLVRLRRGPQHRLQQRAVGAAGRQRGDRPAAAQRARPGPHRLAGRRGHHRAHQLRPRARHRGAGQRHQRPRARPRRRAGQAASPLRRVPGRRRGGGDRSCRARAAGLEDARRARPRPRDLDAHHRRPGARAPRRRPRSPARRQAGRSRGGARRRCAAWSACPASRRCWSATAGRCSATASARCASCWPPPRAARRRSGGRRPRAARPIPPGRAIGSATLAPCAPPPCPPSPPFAPFSPHRARPPPRGATAPHRPRRRPARRPRRTATAGAPARTRRHRDRRPRCRTHR